MFQVVINGEEYDNNDDNDAKTEKATARKTITSHFDEHAEVYVNSEMPDTSRNRRRLIRFIAQEVIRDIGTTREIPHFDKSK